MAAVLRCSNGHDWPSHVGPTAERVDHCPVCGAAPAAAAIQFGATAIGAERTETPRTPFDAAPPPFIAPIAVPGYELLGELGRGGMGVVFKARHLTLGRTVALKMVLSGELAGPEELRRFRAEAEAAAQLQHPNIVQLYEYGEVRTSDGPPRPYFALEYVAGGSLADRLEGKPLPLRPAAELVETIARAMHYAHLQGVIHRDLKPANVLLQRTEDRGQRTENPDSSLSSVLCPLSSASPKVTDFGLAKRVDSSHGPTQTGAILGTPSYMAPEQAAGRSKRVGPAADIYALGAILYELLTGRPPFVGETPLETVLLVTRDEPVPPGRLRPKLSRDLETIALKCLKKDVAKRYATAHDLADDLRRYLDGQPIAARPAGPIERAHAWVRRRPTTAALLAVTTASVLVLIAAGARNHAELRAAFAEVQQERDRVTAAHAAARHRLVQLTVANGDRAVDAGDLLRALPWFVEALRLEADDPARAATHRLRLAAVRPLCPQLLQVWGHDGRVTATAFRPGGRQVLTASDDGTVHLWDLAGLDAPSRVLHLPGPVTQASYSPDGGRLLAVAGRAVHCWDLAADPPREAVLPHPAAVTQAVWAPDGRRVVTGGPGGAVRVWDVTTGQPVGPAVAAGAAVTAVAATGDRVASGTAGGEARVWNAANGQPESPVLKLAGLVRVVAFDPAGRRLLTAAGPEARVWDAATGQPVSPPIRHRETITDAVFNHDGSRVATSSTDDTAGVWDLAKGEWLDIDIKHGSDVLAVRFSPDGRRLATASDDNTARVWDLAAGGPLTPLLVHSGTVTQVAFSPDGQRLISAGEDGIARLWDLPVAAPPSAALLLATAGPVAAVSRDGTLRVAGGADGVARVHDARTGVPLSPPLTHRGAIHSVAFSPDGTRVVTASADRTARVWDWKAGQPVGEAMRHGSGVSDAVFNPDGARVATAGDDNAARVWDAATGRPVTPPLEHRGSVQAVRFSPDGRLLLSFNKGRYAHIWDAASGEPVAPVAVTGWVAATLADPAAAVAWKLPTDDRPVEDWVALAEWLAGHRVDATGGLVPLDATELRRLGEQVRKARGSELWSP